MCFMASFLDWMPIILSVERAVFLRRMQCPSPSHQTIRNTSHNDFSICLKWKNGCIVTQTLSRPRSQVWSTWEVTMTSWSLFVAQEQQDIEYIPGWEREGESGRERGREKVLSDSLSPGPGMMKWCPERRKEVEGATNCRFWSPRFDVYLCVTWERERERWKMTVQQEKRTFVREK